MGWYPFGPIIDGANKCSINIVALCNLEKLCYFAPALREINKYWKKNGKSRFSYPKCCVEYNTYFMSSPILYVLPLLLFYMWNINIHRLPFMHVIILHVILVRATLYLCSIVWSNIMVHKQVILALTSYT